jgi:hypothetical protein
VSIRPKPEDIEELARLIEIRDSAHLAGHRLDPFTLFNFSRTEALLVSPGRTQGDSVSNVAMRRLEDLDLFRVIDRSEKGFTFDLVDDVGDRLEEMRVAVGLPSRMGELEASVQRAEAAMNAAESTRQDLEARVIDDRRARAERRAAFASRVGRWARWLARVALGLLYIGVVVVAGYFVSSNLPLAIVVGIIGVAVVLAALDWLLHIDGFALAAAFETRVVNRMTRWLESFDPGA